MSERGYGNSVKVIDRFGIQYSEDTKPNQITIQIPPLHPQSGK